MLVRLNIMEIIATFSVFVNAGIVAFSGTFAINSTWTERIWIFMGMSSALFWYCGTCYNFEIV